MRIPIFHTPDISCGHCVTTLKKALSPLPGVESVHVDIESQTVRVVHDPDRVGIDTLVRTMEEVGYPIDGEPRFEIEKNASSLQAPVTKSGPALDQNTFPSKEDGSCCGSCHPRPKVESNIGSQKENPHAI
jgi:copper chaperone